ncbi:zinc knuckle (CCHC-type) family protein [Striga asiatica]|uniref:Zinc knuckle (CCHC-type) family protein n=1 Tax=Striga asiatica TaxID=4170 RepID=A0A5A7QUR4_STRAF|nr:zinc knuckle (CCHC-type) family protein [Striga asiatica]
MRIGDGHTGGGRDGHVSSHVAGFSPQMSGSKPDHPGSGGVPNSGGGRQRVCYNCGKSGHLAASCFEVLGYPDWYPRGGAGRRGGRRGRGGRGGGAPAQANREDTDLVSHASFTGNSNTTSFPVSFLYTPANVSSLFSVSFFPLGSKKTCYQNKNINQENAFSYEF